MFFFISRNCLKCFVKIYASSGLPINIKNQLTIQWTLSHMMQTVPNVPFTVIYVYIVFLIHAIDRSRYATRNIQDSEFLCVFIL